MSYIDNMTKIVEQTGDNIIDQQNKIFSEKIKKYAQDYLNIINQNKKELADMASNLQHEKQSVKAIQKANIDAPYEWRILSQNRHLMLKKDHYREMVTASLIFQSQLNELLEQEVELVYVYQDEKNNPTLYTIDPASLFPILTYKKNKDLAKGTFEQGKNDFKAALTKLTKYQLYEKFNLDYFNYTYKQIIWRFNYARSSKKAKNWVMWLNPQYKSRKKQDKWNKATVSSAGDIKEAYASIVLKREINSVKLFNDEKLDNNVHSFMEQVAKVDNESGLLAGDVTVDQIEYAIKGIFAQTLGMNQIVEMAQEILNKANYSEKDLGDKKADFHKRAETRNKIEKLTKEQQEIWEEDLKKILKIEMRNTFGMNMLVKYEPSDFSWFE